MDKKTITAYNRLLEYLRTGQLEHENTVTLSQKLDISKVSTARLLDLMEWQGLIEKRRGKGLMITGVPAFQGHLTFCFPQGCTTQTLRTHKVVTDPMDERGEGGKALSHERMIQPPHEQGTYPQPQPVAFEHHLFHPSLNIGPNHSAALGELYLDRLVYEQQAIMAQTQPSFRPNKTSRNIPSGPQTTGHLGLAPPPPLMRSIFGTEEPQVIALNVQHRQGERLLWHMQRFYHPQWRSGVTF